MCSAIECDMKAIVLSCDKRLPIVHHMLCTYEACWPSNQFVFRIPYNREYPRSIAETWGKKICPCETEPAIRATALGLLSNIEDDEWVYWCIDDKYLIALDADKARRTYKWVSSVQDPEVAGVTFAFVRKVPRVIKPDSRIYHDGLPFYELREPRNVWIHQFFRAGIIRKFFEDMPEVSRAKQMDRFAVDIMKRITRDKRVYALGEKIVQFGESTTRGLLTENCVGSFESYDLPIPADFERSSRHIVIR